MTQTVGGVLRAVARDLAQRGIESAERDAKLLLAMSMGVPHSRLSIMRQDHVSDADLQTLFDLLPDRLARKPMSHITGQRAFWRHDFQITPDVLDPRPETEVLVQTALGGAFDRVLDLGVGSGAILLSLLSERPHSQGMGTDLSPAALEVAQANARHLHVSDRVQWVLSDWLSEVEGAFDLIVSNPPYIAQDEMAGLAQELSYEPRMALTDEADGLSAYRQIARDAPKHLRPGGRLMVEIGPTQADAVLSLFEQAGLTQATVVPDLDGRDRVVTASAP